MDEKMRVAVIILNYNKKADSIACLESVFKLEYSPFEVIFVDNASTDGSAGAVKEAFPAVHVLQNQNNLGVAGGRNAGFHYATTMRAFQYVLFLDNDTQVDPKLLEHLVQAFLADPEAGITCPKTYTEYPSSTLMSVGIVTNLYTGIIRDIGSNELDSGQYDQARYVEACGGFGLLIRRDVFVGLGGFDERYNPYGWEDVDFCLRARRKGYRTKYIPEALLYHKGTKVGRGSVFAYERYKIRNFFLFLKQHASVLQRISCFVFLPIRCFIQTMRIVCQGDFRAFFAQLKGFSEGVLKRKKTDAEQR